VQNPEPGARALAEATCAAPEDDGLRFWRSWAEALARDAPAAVLTRVLRSTAAAQP
jgi:hypothetical protein